MNDKELECKKQISELLGHYENGEKLFINAQKEGTWDYPLVKKAEAKHDPSLPSHWIELAEKVIGIIASVKYDLDTYENRIELIKSDQMLDVYASTGLPVNYEHWSFGKQRIMEDKAYKQGKKGLAYELVINSDPAIAYCMENNSPLMQLLVIAHASFGHNNFFKSNQLFKEFTEAKTIISDLRNMRDFIRECEDKYGYETVEELLDACHALQSHAVNHYKTPEKKTQKAQKAKALEDYKQRSMTPAPSNIYRSIQKINSTFNDESREPLTGENKENLLLYIAKTAPHLQPWQRKIMKMFSDKMQYFYPQSRTKVMNEGWATFWHYTLIHDLEELGLIDNGMMLEFYDSHSGVTFQPGYDDKAKIRTPDGQIKEISIFNGINPYALGFAIFNDIKRICLKPTEEDREWFPEFAGNQDWLSVMKHAAENFADESFIQQYLSPKVMRDFKFFVLQDDEFEDEIEITAIHNKKGYAEVRRSLAADYRIADMFPRIQVHKYHQRTDRRLELYHHRVEGKPIAEDDMNEVLKHIYRLWGHPVVLQSVDDTFYEEDGELEIMQELSCPPEHKL